MQIWYSNNPVLTVSLFFITLVFIMLISRNGIARWIINLSTKTHTKVDDILVKHLKPQRIAWLAPLVVLYLSASTFSSYQIIIEKAALTLILWISAITLTSLITALNELYENRSTYKGVSIQGYLDVVKLLIFSAAVIVSTSIISEQSPIGLLTGLGAITAVLLLVFQGTILSLVASIQINSNDLIKEGDWIEVPSFGADGDVLNISLHTIKVRNFDMTTTVIPTHKLMEVAYKNWRGMRDSGGRRIQRSIIIDMTSMKICNEKMLAEIGKIDLIHDYIGNRTAEIKIYKKERLDYYDSPLDGPQITNTELFRVYIESYLKSRDDIHHSGLPFLVRSLEPTPTGLPIEVYVFTKSIQWETYEAIQSEIFDHLLAAARYFDLRVFQEPTGMDFSKFINDRNNIAG